MMFITYHALLDKKYALKIGRDFKHLKDFSHTFVDKLFRFQTVLYNCIIHFQHILILLNYTKQCANNYAICMWERHLVDKLLLSKFPVCTEMKVRVNVRTTAFAFISIFHIIQNIFDLVL